MANVKLAISSVKMALSPQELKVSNLNAPCGVHIPSLVAAHDAAPASRKMSLKLFPGQCIFLLAKSNPIPFAKVLGFPESQLTGACAHGNGTLQGSEKTVVHLIFTEEIANFQLDNRDFPEDI